MGWMLNNQQNDEKMEAAGRNFDWRSGDFWQNGLGDLRLVVELSA